MTKQAVPDEPVRTPRREWIGLRTAALLSLVLHMVLAAGLTKTGLGILSLPTPDAPAETRNIFRPQPARDFPLEVSRSESATAAHERPLDLPLVKGMDRRPPQPDRARTVSRDRPAEPEEAARPQSRTPERSRQSSPDQPESSSRLDRASATAPEKAAAAAVPSLALAAEASVVPQGVAPQRRPLPDAPSDREAAVAARLPREVAVLSKAPSLPAPRPRESMSAASDAPMPRTTSLSRQPSTAAPSVEGSVAAAALPAGQQPSAAVASPRLQARPRAAMPARAVETAVSRTAPPGAPSPATADLADAAGGAGASPATAAVARQRRGQSADAAANPFGSAMPLARADTAVGTTVAAGAGVVAIPGGGSAAGDKNGAAAVTGIDAGVAGSAPRPSAPSFARTSGRGEPRAGVSAPGGRPSTATDATGTGEGDDDEGLSTDGMALVDASVVTAAAGRRSADTGGAALPQATALPRATAIVLPSETRVRDIATPFRRRMERDRLPHGADDLVARGLDFLKRAQQDDGRWRLGAYPGADGDSPPKLSSDTAATGLAVLSFLGAGHDHFDGEHADTVRRGLEFLMSVQKDDGDLYQPADPLSNSCAWMYSHAIATMALCEAVGMTGDPHVRPAATRACRFISATQHPSRKGWRYTPRSDADLSVSGWMLVALRSGALAGVPVEARTLAGVRDLLDTATIPPSAARTPMASFHYNALKPDQRPSEMSVACMNALGTLMRLHTGWSPRDERVVANSRPLAAALPAYATSGQMARDCYLWYYASQVLVHTGGEPWDRWYAALVDELEGRQERRGPAAGSWDPLGPTPDRWGRYGGRIYVTTLHLLTLEVPARRLPTYSFDDEPR